jgi:hypothetical protein
MLPTGTILIWTIVLALVILVLTFGRAWRPEFAIALLGAVLAAIFHISGAYRAKVSHFLECFSRCNESYAKLKGRLRQQPNPNQNKRTPTAADDPGEAIIDYFNLCAEEHLMYKMRVIPDFVWRVWCAGIHDWATSDQIKTVWDREQEAKCDYYGFDLGQIMREHHKSHGNECGNRSNCPWDRMTVRASLAPAAR